MTSASTGIVLGHEHPLNAVESDAMQALYESAFPPHLRGPWDELIAESSSGDTLLFLARAEGELLGFAHGRPLKGDLPLFLEYIAIEPAVRSRGVGRELMAAIMAHEAARAGVILEIEPLDEGDAAERHERARRHAFYERLGALTVPCAPGYMVPGDGALHRLSLRWLSSELPSGAPGGARLRAILHAIATEGYGLEPGSGEYAALTRGQTC